jgi:hypothetical protein
MIDDIPNTYNKLVEELIKINNRLYERKIERGGWVGNLGGYSSVRFSGRSNKPSY